MNGNHFDVPRGLAVRDHTSPAAVRIRRAIPSSLAVGPGHRMCAGWFTEAMPLDGSGGAQRVWQGFRADRWHRSSTNSASWRIGVNKIQQTEILERNRC